MAATVHVANSAVGPITSMVNIVRYLQPCVAQVVQLLQNGSSVRLVARRFGVSPSVLSLVLGEDFERLASALGELDKGAEGPLHINRTGVSFCVRGDSDVALPVSYKVTCSVALGYRFLTKLSDTEFDIGALCFSQMKVGST